MPALSSQNAHMGRSYEMKNISLEQYYHKIKKKISIVGAYTEDLYVINIIKSCRLKPMSVFSGKDKLLEDVWLDEFNNSIKIKNKKIKVELSSNKLQHTCTDIFRNENIEFLVSKSLLVCIGIADDNKFILVLKGSDNYLRCYECLNNSFVISSPLIIGLGVLKYCFTEPIKDLNRLLIKSEFNHLNDHKWFMIKLPTTRHVLQQINNKQLEKILYNE